MSIKYRIAFLLIWGLQTPDLTLSQNLVPNSSFEIIDSCPDNSNQTNRLHNWYKFINDSPDLFSECSVTSIVGVPQNTGGYQEAHSDSSYVGLGMGYYASICCREYISIKLTDSLLADSTYCLNLYVASCDECTGYNNALGAVFSRDSLYFNSASGYPNWQPSIKFHEIISDTTNWKLISGHFKAEGGEQYMSLGSFTPDNEIQWYGDLDDGSYIYIDDVSVTKCTLPPEQPDTTSNINFIKVYPNPNTGQFTINFGVMEKQNGQYSLWDSSGRLVYQTTNLTGKFERDIHLPQLSSGIYLWRFDVNGGKVDIGKLVIRQ